MKFIVGTLITALIFFYSCSKPSTPEPTPPIPPIDSTPVTPSIPDFTVTNTWECTIDGIHYTGTIDTSFTVRGDSTYTYPDTVITCTGTSSDKKANIYFNFYANGTTAVHATNSITEFDTTSIALLVAATEQSYGIKYSIDSFKYDKVKATFSGQLYYGSPAVQHKVTGGKLSCSFNRGTNEPKKFGYASILYSPDGYINSAVLVSNTLILDGCDYVFGGNDFRLQIRTGENIKPGSYSNKDGNTAIYRFRGSGAIGYAGDSIGNLTVNILSSTNGIITGNFSGADGEGYPIKDGFFSCRVKNYKPSTDSSDQWKFNYIRSYQDFRMYGGNMLKAQLLQQSGKNILIITGNSDYGVSSFKIQLSCSSAIETGDYSVEDPKTMPRRIDSLYFKYNEQILNNGDVVIGPTRQTIVTIDQIDAGSVSGTITDVSYVSDPFIPGFKSGSFAARF